MFDLAPIQPLLARVEAAELRRTVAALPAPRALADPGRAQTAALIEQRFRDAGWQVRRQEFQTAGASGTNVIATRIGSKDPGTVYVLGAHYDTVPGSPGADDNGSAVAGLLAVAEALRGEAFAVTVELAAFDLEEYGFLGSGRYVEQMLRGGMPGPGGQAGGRQQKVDGGLILEMIGYRSRAPHSQKIPTGFDYLYPEQIRAIEARDRRGDFLAIVSNAGSRALAATAGELFRAAEPELPLVSIEAPAEPVRPEVLYLSDHVPFWAAGLPALQLTDSAFLRNPHYHLPSDTPETLDYDFAAAITRGALATLCYLATGRVTAQQ